MTYRACAPLLYAGRRYFPGDLLPLEFEPHAEFYVRCGWVVEIESAPESASHSEADSEYARAIYFGPNMTVVPNGEFSGMWVRGVVKWIKKESRLCQDIRNGFREEFQIINPYQIYIGGNDTITPERWGKIKEHLNLIFTITMTQTRKPRVLILRDMGLGDVLMSMPAVAALKKEIPTASITYATYPAYKPIIENADCIDEIIDITDPDQINLSHVYWDLIVNFTRCLENYNLPRNCGRRVESFFKMLALPVPGNASELIFQPNITDEDEKAAEIILGSAKPPFIGYVLKAASWNRTYPIHLAPALFAQLREQFPNHTILIFDNQPDFGLFTGLPNIINLAGKTRYIGHAAAIMKKCDLVITPDTGMAHMAGALGIKTLVLLSSMPWRWRYDHYGDHIQGLHYTSAAACVPCNDWSFKRPGVHFCNRTANNVCLSTLRADMIVDQSIEMLNPAAKINRVAKLPKYEHIKLSVVVTCHDNYSLTRFCIDSLFKGNRKPDEIILVDNGSTDETQSKFENDPNIIYIRREQNDGSIIGRNVGIKIAEGDKILVLDNDQFVSENTLLYYLQFHEDVVGCEMNVADENGIGRPCNNLNISDRAYLGIGGLMISRNVVESIGVLDEAFAPAYCDDPDYFWRIRQAGFSWAWIQNHEIKHMAHSTLGHVPYNKRDAYKRSHELLIKKWPEKFQKQNMNTIENKPLVSFVIPTYNRVAFLSQCIDSILAQIYTNIEIIVVDDGSTDETESLIRNKYPMVRYLKNEENRRIPYSLNRGFRAARGEFICWLSDDDGIVPDKVTIQLQYMIENPHIDLSFHEYEIRWWGDSPYTGIAGNIQHWKSKQFDSNHDEFLHCLNTETCNSNGSTSMFRRSCFRRMGYFIESLWTCQDWEMWLRFFREGRVGMINQNLGWRNEHKDVSQGLCQKNPDMLKLFDAEKKFIHDYYRLFLNKNRPRICAVMVAKNEEHEIERCLDDLILWCDEIAILDDGSIDRTVELVKQYPKVKILIEKSHIGNIRHEGHDRQLLLKTTMEKSSCEWHFFIDCDEVADDLMKSKIYDMITDPKINLYHFHELNFWRSQTYYRVDEMYNRGWFGRLYRVSPGLFIRTNMNEHCGGIPQNIPGCSMWYCGDHELARKSKIQILHYGFSEYERTVAKAWKRWNRDPLRNDEHGNLHGGWVYYERMINETGLELKKYDRNILIHENFIY